MLQAKEIGVSFILCQCAYCGLLLNGPHQGEVVPVIRQGNVSHGICIPCKDATWARYLTIRELRRSSKQQDVLIKIAI